MGATFCKLVALLLLFSVSAIGQYRTNTTVPTLFSVTPNVQTENLSAYLRAFYTLSTGEPHVVLGFDGTYPQVWDVNLSNSTSRTFTMTNAIYGADTAAQYGTAQTMCITTLSNTLLVCATSQRSNQVWEFNPATGSSQMILTNSDKVVVSMCRAPDGVIFMGTYGTVQVDAWNPSNRTSWTYGPADTNLVGVGNYGYYIAANNTHVYTVVRGGTPAWYLSITDRATTNKTIALTNGSPTTFTLYDGKDGNIYAAVITNGVYAYYILTNGTPAVIGSIPTTTWDAYYQEPGHAVGSTNGWVNRDFDNWETNTVGYSFDLSPTVYSVDGSIPTVSMRWRQAGSTNWQSATETNGWLPSAASFPLVQTWTNNSLLWLSSSYGPIGSFTPGGSAYVLGPYKGQSTRDVLQVSSSQVYIAGYHRFTMRWDPTSAWTKTPSTPDFTSTNVNPYTVYEGGGKYHSMTVRGSNNRIYTASRWDRDGVGGSLSWYDPSDGSTGTERAAFTASTDTPSDLKTAVGSAKLVWCSWGGNVFVWDVATFTQVTNFTLPGITRVEKCVEYSSGNLFGVSSAKIFGFNLNGTLLHSNSLPAAPFSITSETTDYERLTLGPDGYVWVTAGGLLYRINPEDGSRFTMRNVTNNSKIMFRGVDAFLYGGTSITSMSNLLVSTASEARITSGRFRKTVSR